jgi:hypothetical protein
MSNKKLFFKENVRENIDERKRLRYNKSEVFLKGGVLCASAAEAEPVLCMAYAPA